MPGTLRALRPSSPHLRLGTCRPSCTSTTATSQSPPSAASSSVPTLFTSRLASRLLRSVSPWISVSLDTFPVEFAVSTCPSPRPFTRTRQPHIRGHPPLPSYPYFAAPHPLHLLCSTLLCSVLLSSHLVLPLLCICIRLHPGTYIPSPP
ncbi:hypothetical protein LIA77_04773 [Sarocladium implicatum]|nr:hypothetical protein LIA77_04773 [Sarocladium implicatum]